MKMEQVTSALMEDKRSQITQLSSVTKHAEHGQNHEGREYCQDDYNVQIFSDAKRPTFAKNDSNNNNRDNGKFRQLTLRAVQTMYLNSTQNTLILFV